MRVIFAGGVTGGHIAPGVALAEHILSGCPGSEVLFASVANETEERMIARRGLPLVKVTERNSGAASVAVHVPAAVFRSRRLIASFKPDVVVGLGAGASLGPALAALTMRTPLVLLEQNVIPGQANRMLARWAAGVCCQWESSIARFPAGAALFTGSPVRREILRARTADKAPARLVFGLGKDLPTLLVMGGSQGASPINRVMMASAARLAGRVQVVHLAGAADAPTLDQAYRAAGLAAHVSSFAETMHLAYAAADIAMCRAGATSLAELAAVGLPAILVPLPHAKDDHQRANARAAVEQKWAVLVEQAELTADWLVTLVCTWITYHSKLDSMRQQALASARDDAAAIIINAMAAVSPRGKEPIYAAEQGVGG